MEIKDIPNFGLFWNGWKTTIFELAQQGWNIYTEKNIYERRFNLAFEHYEYKVVGLSVGLDETWIYAIRDDTGWARGHKGESGSFFPTIPVQYLNFKININIVGSNPTFNRFTQVDKVYSYPDPNYTIDLTSLFPKKELVKENNIIVPEYTIPELMKFIKEKQAPKQKEIRERLRKETNPIIKEEARIITLNNAPHSSARVKSS